uniref:Uncharacterized protein n=1 Tax=Sciurus vulgaris TaxID=55149 RepID=A0A8D2D261_SCIVU
MFLERILIISNGFSSLKIIFAALQWHFYGGVLFADWYVRGDCEEAIVPPPRLASLAEVSKGDLLAKIADIKAKMSQTQKKKATAHHLGLLKTCLAKLCRKLITQRRCGGGHGEAPLGSVPSIGGKN